jgi:glycosyltransferase involved in cell wall biosynthesis
MPIDRWSSRVSDRPLRFAVVIQTPKDPHSAVYIGYQALGSALERLGHSVELVSPGDFPAIAGMNGRWIPLAYPFAIARWLRRRRRDFDLVMFHSYSGWLATAFAGGHPRSLVMFHGVEPLYHRELRQEAAVDGRGLSWRYRVLQELVMPVMLRIGCRTATGVACLNHAEADYLVSRNWVPGSGAAVMAHGAPPEFFAPPRGRRPIEHVLFVGQWLPMKGVRYLRDSAITVLRDNPSMRLTCAGTLVSEQTVTSDFPQEHRDRISVLPRVDQSTLVKLYRDADVFVFPSLYEGFSRAIIEAMASRLPIVCTPVGVAADALKHEESALVVSKRSAPAIVAAIQRLRDDPALAEQLANAAGEIARSFALADVSQRTIRVIMNTAGRPQ